MQARIRVTVGRDIVAELASLREWLRREAAFRGQVQVDASRVNPDTWEGSPTP